MGIISAIGNVALVAATFVVGFLAAKSWHLPFLVYLLPLLSLVLIPFLKKIPKSDYASQPADAQAAPAQNGATSAAAKPATAAPAFPAVDEDGFSTAGQTVKGGFYLGRTVWLMLAYFFFVFATSIPAYYLPNLMPQYHMTTEEVSTVTSIFYLAMFLIGLVVTGVMKIFGKSTFIITGLVILAGFLIFWFTDTIFMYILAAALIGLGNGLAQPIFYNKATELVVNKSKSTLSLAYLQVSNYVAISLVPVITELFMKIFNNHSNLFPFIMITVMMAIVCVCIIVRYKHFTFGISKSYYE